VLRNIELTIVSGEKKGHSCSCDSLNISIQFKKDTLLVEKCNSSTIIIG